LADTANPKVAPNRHDTLNDRSASAVHPAWQRLMRYCRELGHGEIEKLKIEDGLPMVAEVITRKIKFSS
jgi:hypothetical protein